MVYFQVTFNKLKASIKLLIKDLVQRRVAAQADGEVTGRGVLGSGGPEKPGGGKDSFPPTVVDKHSGLWTRRREFESLPGYQIIIFRFFVYASRFLA